MMAELPTTPKRGNTVNMMVNPVPYKSDNMHKPNQPSEASGKCNPVWVPIINHAKIATQVMVLSVRTRPSKSPASCCVNTMAIPNKAAAANAKNTPSPITAHWPCAPKPEEAPKTSNASASPINMMGMTRNTAGSGWCL